MARCRCLSTDCPCQIIPGSGVVITGSGNNDDPFVISAPPRSSGTIAVGNTPSLDLEIQGQGVPNDPYLITGHIDISPVIVFSDTGEITFLTSGNGTEDSPLLVTAEMPDVSLEGGSTGDVLTLQPDGTWAPGPPNQVAPGAVLTGQGLVGDGSGGSPVRINLCTYADLAAACAP